MIFKCKLVTNSQSLAWPGLTIQGALPLKCEICTLYSWLSNICLLRQLKPTCLFLWFQKDAKITSVYPPPFLPPSQCTLLLVLLPNDKAGDTQFGGANAIIMAESSTSLAHDHGFQSAVTFRRCILYAVLFRKGLNRNGLAVAAGIHSLASRDGCDSHWKGHDITDIARYLATVRHPWHSRVMVHVRRGGDVDHASVAGPDLCGASIQLWGLQRWKE